MSIITDQPTPYPDVNTILSELLTGIQSILADHLVGMYLEGSLASGDFDQDSDIDFVAVTDQPVTADQFESLQAMHDRIASLDSIWAIQLEGSYLSRHALRRHDPVDSRHPNIERGQDERLKWVAHDATWDIHRCILRERGIILTGPAPHTLIDAVSSDTLRQAMAHLLKHWAAQILANPAQIQPRGYQSYTVLSMCRVLYTLQYGTITSKPVAARWAQAETDPRWTDLIERAWIGRHHSNQAATAKDIDSTLDLIRYTMAQVQG